MYIYTCPFTCVSVCVCISTRIATAHTSVEAGRPPSADENASSTTPAK